VHLRRPPRRPRFAGRSQRAHLLVGEQRHLVLEELDGAVDVAHGEADVPERDAVEVVDGDAGIAKLVQDARETAGYVAPMRKVTGAQVSPVSANASSALRGPSAPSARRAIAPLAASRISQDNSVATEMPSSNRR
jgi:hypothetical protein